MVDQATGSPPQEGYRNWLQLRPVESAPASPWLFDPASQTHDERQTRRGSLSASCQRTRALEKKATHANASEVLIYQDEVEIHRHPTLCRIWAPIGSQLQAPAPGQNEKTVVYGEIDYATARITYTVAPTKSGGNFLIFLIALLKADPGRKICLVCDNGGFHHTQAAREWLKEHRRQIQVYWLPPYSPSLNLIERLWGHLKRTILANVLYRTLDDLVVAFHCGVARIGRRDLMEFMFNHEKTHRIQGTPYRIPTSRDAENHDQERRVGSRTQLPTVECRR